jgi:hypothetical protein
VVGEEAWRKGRGIVVEEDRGSNPWTKQEAERFYGSTLEEAAVVANRSVSKGLEESRRKTFEEFQDFLGLVGQGKKIENANGLDVVAFIHGYWLKKHKDQCRTRVGGKRVASASAVKGVVQHVAKSFSMLGYADEQNPGKAESVKSYRDGYRNRLHEQEVRERRAKLMKSGKVTDLVTYLEEQNQKESGVKQCCLLTDLAIVHYLWETWARGKECGELESSQVDLETGIVSPRSKRSRAQKSQSTLRRDSCRRQAGSL